MLVAEIMSTHLVTCSIDETLQSVAEHMLENAVGSVLIADEGQPVGIVTETDMVYAGYVTERPFTEIPIENVMSRPLETVLPDKTLREATQRMKEESVKKLVVLEDMDVIGILTAQDVIHNYPELKSEIADIMNPDEWQDIEGD